MAFGDFTVDRASKKYVLGSDGFLKEYANDEPAIEFNADGSYKGVLVEPQSVNDCLQSEDINTTWTPNPNAAPTQSTETTPDGDSTNKYIKLVDDGGGGTGGIFVSQSISVSADTTYTFSVFLKADQLSFARLEAVGYAAISGHQYFGLSGSGSLGTAFNLDDSKIEAYPNDWYRCSITYRQGVGDTDVALRIWVANSISNVSNLPIDGTSSIFVWGAQLEASPIATSYIPTTTGAVTRLKDDIYLTSASSLIGQTEGTLFVEVDWQEASSATITQTLLSAHYDVDNRIKIYKDTDDYLNMFVQEGGGATEYDDGVDASAYTGIQKIAFAYDNGDVELYVNGSSVKSGTPSLSGFASPLANVEFAQDYNADNQANMWIRTVALFTTRLSDTQCEDLTTI